MDLFDDLLEVLDNHIDLEEGSGATSPSVHAALAKEPPVHLPSDSSISLLSECFANVWAESDSTSGNSSNLPLTQPLVASDAPSVATDPTLPTPKSERGTSSRLSKAVKNRMQRDKAGAPPSSEASDSTGTAAADISKDDRTECALEPRDTSPAGGKDNGGNAIATACFQSFLAEMKDFQQNSSQLETRQDIRKYAEYLHQKYITLGYDKIPDADCIATAKTRKLIENFIAKLRSRADESATVDTPTPWACAVCTFQNGPSNSKCQTCGRARGTTPKKKAPPKPVHVPIISAHARAKKSNKTPLDRRKDIFLKQKDNYEQDAREDIADEISELLSAVRAVAHKSK